MQVAPLVAAFALALAALAGACATPAPQDAGAAPPPADARSPTDEPLLFRIREAVADKVPAGDIAMFVGKQPIFDTTTGEPLDLSRVELRADPKHLDERFAQGDVQAVIYWKRLSDVASNLHVVGVQFGAAGAARVFFAIVPQF